jgi:hypothetical protein
MFQTAVIYLDRRSLLVQKHAGGAGFEMPGDVSAFIEGFAVPVISFRLGHRTLKIGDHTYVVSSCGYSWECFGQVSNGTQIAADFGNSFVAECLSLPRGTSIVFGVPIYAGIHYGITGVCHQASNRILFPAGRALVSKARGYGASQAMFGRYGIGGRAAWAQLPNCLSLDPNSTLSADMLAKTVESIASQNSRTRSDLHMMTNPNEPTAPPPESEEDSYEEMVEFYNSRLGSDHLSHSQLASLFGIQSELRQRQSELVELLKQHEITKEKYMFEVNNALESSMRRNREVLGERDYTLAFDEREGVLSPIDPAIFISSPHAVA